MSIRKEGGGVKDPDGFILAIPWQVFPNIFHQELHGCQIQTTCLRDLISLDVLIDGEAVQAGIRKTFPFI